MTLRSPRKRRITALTFRQGIRLSLAALLTGTSVNGIAQNPYPARGTSPAAARATIGNVPLRPVPRHGAVATPAATNHDPQRPGWDLRWRRSPQVNSAQVNSTQLSSSQKTPVPTAAPGIGRGQPSPAFDSARSATSLPQVSGGLKVANETPRLLDVSNQEIAPVAWMGDPQRSDPFAAPNDLRLTRAQEDTTPQATVPDFFDTPFADNPSAPARSAEVENEDAFVLPPPADQQLVPPAPDQLDTDNQLRGPIEFEQRSTQPEPPQQPSFFPPVGDPSAPEPPAATPKADNGPSLGEMLRESTPGSDQDQGESVQELPAPAPRAPQLTPAPQQPFINPFEDRKPSEADRMDRDRLNDDRVIEGDYRPDGTLYGSGTDFLDPKAFTCDDFRQRIAEQTIDKVSLDVSPPFRPDEFDNQRYERLKADFDEKQVIRNWVSVDGRELAEGRLRDLAYEKAVIETEDGAIQRLPINRLSEGDIAYITENWGLPRECLIDQAPYVPRTWVATTMTWKASNLCHNPLYFEDVNLERYGHTRGPLLEPLVQSAHFFGNIAVLPYKMGVHGPHECQYALGYYRPGDCAPWIKPPVPISARGAIAQAATMTGLFWLIP